MDADWVKIEAVAAHFDIGIGVVREQIKSGKIPEKFVLVMGSEKMPRYRVNLPGYIEHLANR